MTTEEKKMKRETKQDLRIWINSGVLPQDIYMRLINLHQNPIFKQNKSLQCVKLSEEWFA